MEGLIESSSALQFPPVPEKPATILEILDAAKFREDVEPPEEDVILKQRGFALGSAGNLGNVGGQSKSGKSTGALQAILGAGMANAGEDVLHFQVCNPERLKVSYFDLEMSKAHFYKMVQGAMRRAHVSTLPDWIDAYHLTDLDHKRRLEALKAAIEASPHRIVLVDGFADLVLDTNCIEEANKFTANLHTLAIQNNMLIVGVLHLNPGSQAGSKMRGHLGSQLERKSEFVLTCEREGDLIQMWTPQCRNRPILKDEAIGMRYDPERGMFVVAENKACAKASQKRQDLTCLLIEAANGDSQVGWRYKDLVEAIIQSEGGSDRTAKRRISEMHSSELVCVRAGTGYYYLMPEVREIIEAAESQ